MSQEFAELPKTVQKAMSAAIGWMNLGNWQEARKELDSIPNGEECYSLVASLYLEVLSAGKQWREMQVRAGLLAEKYPGDVQWLISLAYATRRAESLPAARMILRTARERFPQDGLVSYNLACYAAQLNELEEAGELLLEAVKRDKLYKELALTDSDLEPIRKFVLDIQ